MYVCTLLVLLLLKVITAEAQNLVLNGVIYRNNSVIFFEDFGEGDDSLNCRTTKSSCCQYSREGEWYFPDGRLVPIRGAGESFYRNRDDDGNVRLNKRNNAVSPKGKYYCILPNDRGVMTKLSIVIYTAEDYPEVTRHPQDQLNVDPGSNVSFSVVSIRSSSFHWYFNGSQVPSNFLKYQGIRHSVLTIFNVSKRDEGVYSCVVGNRILSVLSKGANLSLLTPPIITTQPIDAVGVAPGSDVTFSVEAEGLRLMFSWLRTDGLPLEDDSRFEGETSKSLTIREVEPDDSGMYLCAVSNGAGTVLSNEVQLAVRSLEPDGSINVTTFITSALVTWVPPATSNYQYHELQYFPLAFPSLIITVNTTLTEYEVTRLIPLTQYRFQVRVRTDTDFGEWTRIDVLLDQKLPSVEELSVRVVDSTSVSVFWDPPPDLPGWNFSYYYLYYSAYFPSKTTPEVTFKEVVDGSRTSVAVEVDKLVVGPTVVHVFEVSAVLEIKDVEGIGEVKSEKAMVNTTLYETLPFQIIIGPTDYCIQWDKEKAVKIRAVLHESLLQAVSSRCACSLPKDFINRGFFSCRNSQNTATYRSTVTGLNATELIDHIQDWVSSGPTVVLDWYYVDVNRFCPVAVSRLDEPDCQILKSVDSPPTSTLITSDPEIIECVNSCRVRNDNN